MISPDTLGYKCCTPPAYLHISSQRKVHAHDAVKGGRPLPEEEEAMTIRLILSGLSSKKVGQRLHRDDSTIRNRMYRAGYGYNVRAHRWERIE